MIIPYSVLRCHEDLIELKSDCHYWILLKNSKGRDTYFLYHKYELKHQYHRQLINPISLHSAINYIRKHDEYINAKGNE